MGDNFATDHVFSIKDKHGAKMTLCQEQSDDEDCQSLYLEIEDPNDLSSIEITKKTAKELKKGLTMAFLNRED